MRHETLAEAYRDLERASGRLALIGRLAALLARTPAELLSTVCYLCQGSDRPGVRWGGLGLAEKLAVRAVTTATGRPMCGSSPGLVLEILSAELTLLPNCTAGLGQVKEQAGLAMRFPRFTGRWRDDKPAGT